MTLEDDVRKEFEKLKKEFKEAEKSTRFFKYAVVFSFTLLALSIVLLGN